MNKTPRPQGLLIVPGLISAVLLLAAFILLLQLVFLTAGNAAYRDGDHLDAERQYSRAMKVSVLNRWVPPFDRGVARFELQRWDAASADFESAAALAPDDQQCPVRLNWSLALEMGADELRNAEDIPGALVRYMQAEVVLAETTCPDEMAAGGGTLADAWDEARQRVESKKTQGNATFNPPEESSGVENPLDELDERSQQAQEERQRSQDQQSGSEPVEGGSGERNW